MFRVSLLSLTAAAAIWASPKPAECLALIDDAITAAHLAPLAPAFSALPGPTRVAWAPAPGVTRWISRGELIRLGHQHGLAIPADSTATGVCIIRLVEPLDREKVLAAMRAAGPAYEVDLISYGPKETPPGRLEFSAQTLPHPPRPANRTLAPPLIQWRGRVVSAAGRFFPVWARARIVVRRPALVAVRPISPGEIVAADAIERLELVDYPGWEAPLADPAVAIGRRARRAIAARSPLLAPLLALRRDIERGDSVTVELPGEATLTAEADSPGRTGETILLRNPLTGRRFPSKVTGAGKAQIQAARRPVPPAAPLSKSPITPLETTPDARP